jgi:general secretion pathway protein A
MYYSHFGLSGSPFQLTSSPAALYMSKEHREAFSALEWGLLHESSGFTVLVGEVGTGKTTLTTSILARGYQNVRTAYLNNPRLAFEEILKLILKQLGIKNQRRSRLAALEALTEFARRLKPGERVAIIVDEAQDLSDETMEQFRLLSNSETSDERRLHFVFVGQPELVRRLTGPGLRQLDQRVGARAVLNPLQRAEIHEYVEQRLQAVGGTTSGVFKPGAMRYLVRHSGGIPRRINVLCHNAMLLAYSAGALLVDARMLEAAVTEYDSLFSKLRGVAHPNGNGASIREWTSRALESVALRMLAWSRVLYPRELRALEAAPARPVAQLHHVDGRLQEAEPMAPAAP